ncbi:ProQ/FINO family protein [Herbiconiux daphne]|uniref:ProQ/FINO family protein n=1 Tax=Herbiconiux daphne TaxID=2970914 RepID=A0ABT2H9R9_9MICO|nr:ProQ/FINO family protein [Herbiconiux daphne]MCS5736629.1 ProQ/FINO family protein [Herbiconiux daphne]
MRNNSPSQRRYRAKQSAKYFGKPTAVQYDFYKRRIGELCERFPAVFNKALPLTLAKGIHHQLVEETDFTEEEIHILLRVWCKRWEYKCMAVSTGRRWDLSGNDVGLIESSELVSFIRETVNLRPQKLKIFCKRYLKATGRPGLICIPIKDRPELEITDD